MSELPKFKLHYYKAKPVDFQYLENKIDNNDISYNPHLLDFVQHYNPIYSELFDLTPDIYNNIHLNNPYQFVDMNTVEHQATGQRLNRPVFIKYSPLVDPTRYMAGKYEAHRDSLRILPAVPHPDHIYHKIECPNNSAYTDTFFNFLSSTLLHAHGLKNGIEYYGSFLGIQQKFKFNITDELEYLSSSMFFKENNNKLFQLSNCNIDPTNNRCTRMNRNRIRVADTQKHNITVVSLPPIEDTATTHTDSPISKEEDLVYERKHSSSDSEDEGERMRVEDVMNSDSDSNISDSCSENDDTDDDDDWEDVSESSMESDEPQSYAYIHNFPVQLICQEKCSGTIDELFENEKLGCDESLAAMFQIIMTLICYQKAFRFTHNDLHTNNIMYVHTEAKYLYYRYENVVYKVPTFGRIYKIIDFGRSIYYYQDHTFCSDSFAPNGDAHTQYNCEPYLSHDKPRLDPNYSFDLCRLGCSIFDFIMDISDNVDGLDTFQRTILRWCTDDNEKNILYKKNGDERYPHFKLYKMIARNVHHHTPKEQLSFPEFSCYALSKSASFKLSKDIEMINIDTISCYA